MKKKLLGIMSLVLCLGMLLTSCGKSNAFKDSIVDPYVNENPTLIGFAESKVFDDEDVDMQLLDSFDGRYVLFQNNDVIDNEKVGEAYIVLYDAKDSKVIKTWNYPDKYDEENSKKLSYTEIAMQSILVDGYYYDLENTRRNFSKSEYRGIYNAIYDDEGVIAFYVVYKNYNAKENETTYNYTVYNLDGSEVFSADIIETNFNVNEHLNGIDYEEYVRIEESLIDYVWAPEYKVIANNLIVNNSLYKIGSKLIKVESYNQFSYVPEIYPENVGEKYLYKETNNSVVIYDFDFNVVATYNMPIVSGGEWSILKNGNIFFEGYKVLSEDSKKYDVIETNYGYTAVKKELVYEIYNVEKDKVIELDFDKQVWLYNRIEDDSDYNVFGGEVSNLVIVYDIEDGYVSETAKVMAMDNEGKLSELPKVVPNQFDIRVSGIKGYFIVTDMSGNEFLVDSTGKVLGDWYIVSESIEERNDSYFISDGAIYDWNLNKVMDIPEEYLYVGKLANGFMFMNETKNEVAEGEEQTYTRQTIIFKDGVFTNLTSYKSDENGLPVAGEEMAMAMPLTEQLYIIQKATANEFGEAEDIKLIICNEKGSIVKEFAYDDEDSLVLFDVAVEAEDGSYVMFYTPNGTVYTITMAMQSIAA